MKNMLVKITIAFGFVSLISVLFFGYGFYITKYDLLAKEYTGNYPTNKSFNLDHCQREPEIRSFTIKGKPAKTIPILTYHRIISEKDLTKKHKINGKINPMIVTTENFKEHMDYLKDNKFVTLTLDELYAFLSNDLEIPEKSVVLTFDDGYKNNFVEAYPILKKHGFSATNFLVTGSVTNRFYLYDPEKVQYLSTKELSQACDVFEYGSHTYTFHKRSVNENKEKIPHLLSKTKEEVRKDIKTSLHHLNNTATAFAYPYGAYLPSTIGMLKELGIKMAFTSDEEVASPENHKYEIPRLPIYFEDSIGKFKSYVNQ